MDWARDMPTWPHGDWSRQILSRPHRWHVQEAGKGPTLLFLHGAGGATQSFRDLLPLFTDAYHVVAPDLPGQGFTKLGTRQRCGIDRMAEDIKTLCHSQHWAPQAIIGHSAGGALALRLSQMMEVPRIVGINPALSHFDGVAGWLFPMLAKLLALNPFVPDLLTLGAGRATRAESLTRGTGSTIPEEGYRLYSRLIRDRQHVEGTLQMMAQWALDGLLADLPNITAKVLLITGDRDRAVPPDTSVKAAAQIPDAQVIDLPGLGHLAHEEDPERVAQHIRAFLTA